MTPKEQERLIMARTKYTAQIKHLAPMLRTSMSIAFEEGFCRATEAGQTTATWDPKASLEEILNAKEVPTAATTLTMASIDQIGRTLDTGYNTINQEGDPDATKRNETE